MSRAFGLESPSFKYEWVEKADNDEIAEALANDPGSKPQSARSRRPRRAPSTTSKASPRPRRTSTIVDAVSARGLRFADR